MKKMLLLGILLSSNLFGRDCDSTFQNKSGTITCDNNGQSSQTNSFDTSGARNLCGGSGKFQLDNWGKSCRFI